MSTNGVYRRLWFYTDKPQRLVDAEEFTTTEHENTLIRFEAAISSTSGCDNMMQDKVIVNNVAQKLMFKR